MTHEGKPPDQPHGAAINNDALNSMKEVLDAAEVKGIKIAELTDDPLWSDLEIETGSGRILLSRQEWPVPGFLMGHVEESSDPGMKSGWEIVIEGITSNGGSARIGVLGPGARMAFRKKTTKHYKVGDTDSDETMTLTPEKIDEYTAEPSDNFVRTEDGMDLVFFDPTPRGTDFISHLITVSEEDGEKKSRYLF